MLGSGTALRGLIVAAAVLALTGCAGASAASPDHVGSVRSTPSPSVSPSTSPTASPAAEPLTLSTAGLGALRMGSPVPADTDLVAWDPEGCGPDAESPFPPGRWKATVSLSGPSPTGHAEPFAIVTEGRTRSGSLAFLQVWSSEFLTPSGLHVGSTNGEVRSALPTASVLDTGQSLEYSVDSGGWRITLTVADPHGAPITDATSVLLISVAPASVQQVSYWVTDGTAGCSRA